MRIKRSKTQHNRPLQAQLALQLTRKLAPGYGFSPTPFIAAGAIAVLALLNKDALLGAFADINSQRAHYAVTQHQAQLLQDASELADSRYKSLCSFIFSPEDLRKPVPIVEGLKTPEIADGSPVCDIFGATGIIGAGRVMDIAVSTNPDRYSLIQNNLRSKGLQIEPGDPSLYPAPPIAAQK